MANRLAAGLPPRLVLTPRGERGLSKSTLTTAALSPGAAMLFRVVSGAALVCSKPQGAGVDRSLAGRNRCGYAVEGGIKASGRYWTD